MSYPLFEETFKHVYHTTPLENVPFIAQDGLVPNAGGLNFKEKDLQDRSKGRTFFWPVEAKVRDTEEALSNEGKREHATLRVKHDPKLNLQSRDWHKNETPIPYPPKEEDLFHKVSRLELRNFASKQLATGQDIKPEDIEFYDATLGGDGYQDITAHHPETYFKLDPDRQKRSPSIEKPKGQMALFPLELYSEMVNSIVDGLLNE